MRNLKLQYCKQITTILPNTKYILLDPSDKTNDLVYLITSDQIYSYRTSSSCLIELSSNISDIVGAEYLTLSDEICLATHGGQVLLFNPQKGTSKEGVYSELGIDSMSWCPDQEIVAFVTKERNLVVMTSNFDTIAEHKIDVDCELRDQFINVGWGTKKTQFHGSAGKNAANETNGFQAPNDVTKLTQDIKITWRGDGGYFALSFVTSDVGRMFKVFDREGVLKFTSEKLNNIQPPIAWRPSGNWIAVPQILPNKSTVALFEKNGLRHREIVLPFDLNIEPIENLKWSSDSNILAIETKHIGEERNTLYLYTIGNYHWYLKQVLHFKITDPIAVFDWDIKFDEEKTLHVVLKGGQYFTYKWQLGVDKYKRSGLVGVIDGKKLLVTDFSKAIVPPPMSSAVVEFDDYVNVCVFFALPEKNEVCLLAYDSNHNIHIYKGSSSSSTTFQKDYTLRRSVNFKNKAAHLGNLFWLGETYMVTGSSTGHATRLSLLTIESKDEYDVVTELDIKGVVSALVNGCSKETPKTFFAQTLDGKVLQIAFGTSNTFTTRKLFADLKSSACQMEWIYTKDASHLIALLDNQDLYIDTNRIAEGVISFCMAGDYLAFTKLTTLSFYSFTEKVISSERKVERGGRLITITNNSRAIMQMPRGNLETIYPRTLTFETIGCLLDSKQYFEAMELVRKERINMNIICDHNVTTFTENLDVFLDETKERVNWVNLFLTDLKNEDFTKTMYASHYKVNPREYPQGFKIEEKVKYICGKLLKLMGENRELYNNAIIIAHVKIGQIEEMLLKIWHERKLEDDRAGGDAKRTDESIKYLTFLVDVNRLYNCALGTYDVGLIVYVAQMTQKDPKEYLSYLNELKAYDPSYRKFKIDEQLKRYEKAVHNIAVCGKEKLEEALAFIKKHELYKTALIAYRLDQACYLQIALAYADHLRASGQLENASIMYERGGNLVQALLSAKHVLDWQRVLYLATKSGQDVASIGLSMVSTLESSGKYKEAFQLSKTYGVDFTEALKSLLVGKQFLEAIYETNLHKCDDNVKNGIFSKIGHEIMLHCTQLESKLCDDEEQFLNYKMRLLKLREQKAKPKLLGHDNYPFEVDECDLLSDTSSMRSSAFTGSSQRTGKTFRSSKNRRKHERKLFSLKPGNPFEDIALIDALYNLANDIFSQQQHIRDTNKALIELHRDKIAVVLQEHYKKLLGIVSDSLDAIWIKELNSMGQMFLTGPNVDYTQLQNEQRYAMINPAKRIKPELNVIDWEFEILK